MVSKIVANFVVFISRLWGRRGIGTIFRRLISFPIFADAKIISRVKRDVQLEVKTFDYYWGPYLVGGREYEPDVRAIIDKLSVLDAVFIDGGANIGYWSAYVSGKDVGWTNVVAIEASPYTYVMLKRNSELNNNRFKCINRAIFDVSDQTVCLEDTDQHGFAHIGMTGVEVETITLDDAIKLVEIDTPDTPVIVKLDVEGVEVKAIEGAVALKRRDNHAFLYEDWQLTGFPVSEYLLNHGYNVYAVSSNGECKIIKQIEDAISLREENLQANQSLLNSIAFRGDRMDHCYPLNPIATVKGNAIDKIMSDWSKCSL